MTNYQRGRNFEYAVANFLRKRGWHVTRSAGSHGLFDLVALPTQNACTKSVLLIQCKNYDVFKFTAGKDINVSCDHVFLYLAKGNSNQMWQLQLSNLLKSLKVELVKVKEEVKLNGKD